MEITRKMYIHLLIQILYRFTKIGTPLDHMTFTIVKTIPFEIFDHN
jgi:hypothetical protein